VPPLPLRRTAEPGIDSLNPSPHVHHEFDEEIYVFDGRLRFVGDEELEAGPDRCSPHRAATGTVLAVRTIQQALYSASGVRPRPRWRSCAISGAVLVPGVARDTEQMRDLYGRHASPILT
jgi:uncharacterized cupin superfamily protein